MNFSFGGLKDDGKYYSKVDDFTLHERGIVLGSTSHPNETYWKEGNDE
jgi:hypothetical protein